MMRVVFSLVVSVVSLSLPLIACTGQEPEQPVSNCDLVDVPGPVDEFAYVLNADSGDITVIDPWSCEVLTTIEVGGEPVAANASASGLYVYVADQAGKRLVVIETENNTVLDEIPVNGTPVSLRFDTDHAIIWVDLAEGGFDLFDIATRQIVGSIVTTQGPKLMAMTEWSRPFTAYVSVAEDDRVLVLDAQTNAELSVLPFQAPRGIGYSYIAQRVVVCDDNGAHIIATDGPLKDTVVASFPEAMGCRDVHPDDRSTVVWLSFEGRSDIWALDVSAEAVVATLQADGNNHSVSFFPDWESAVAVPLAEANADIVNTQSLEFVGAIDLPAGGAQAFHAVGSRGVVESLDGRHLYVTNPDDGSLTIIDAKSGRTRATLPTGRSPTAVVAAGPAGGSCC